MIVLQGLRPTLAGLIVGLAAALASGRLVASLVFGVGTSDPATLAPPRFSCWPRPRSPPSFPRDGAPLASIRSPH
jgi:hypothetical protein